MKPEPFTINPVIISSDPQKWTKSDLDFIQRVMAQTKNTEVKPLTLLPFVKSTIPVRPKVYISTLDNKTRFSHEWFEKYITNRVLKQGFNFIIWDITEAERDSYGVTQFAGGYWTDNNDYLECWIAVDRDQKLQRGKTEYAFDPLTGEQVLLTELQRLVFHEGGHAVTHFSGRRAELANKYGLAKDTLITHYFDYELKDVTRVYREVNFERWSLLSYIKSLLEQLRALLMIKIDLEAQVPLTPPKVPIQEEKLTKWALAIQAFEDYVKPGEHYRDGTVAPEGSLSYRNNNPGNLRWSPFQAGERNNFSFFNSYQEGYNALIHQLRIAADGRSSVYRPDMTILEFFEKYAPSSDNNYPHLYAKYVADHVGVPIETKIKTLI